jgi:hypothetical protein
MWRLRWRLAGPGPAIVDPVHGFVEAAEDKEMETGYAEGKNVRSWGWQSGDDAPQDRPGPVPRTAFSTPIPA